MGKNILIVDDVASLRVELVYMVEDEGHSPLEAGNGLEAIEVMTHTNIDLLITDVMMPEMDGIELSCYCRKSFPDLKIIIMSGGGNLNVSDQGNKSDIFEEIKDKKCADQTFKKPFDYDDMVTAINKFLE